MKVVVYCKKCGKPFDLIIEKIDHKRGLFDPPFYCILLDELNENLCDECIAHRRKRIKEMHERIRDALPFHPMCRSAIIKLNEELIDEE